MSPLLRKKKKNRAPEYKNNIGRTACADYARCSSAGRAGNELSHAIEFNIFTNGQ